jgi:hypothetical protein
MIEFFKNVRLTGEGHRYFLGFTFDMHIQKVIAEQGFRLIICVKSISDSKLHDGEWPIPVSRYDGVEIETLGRWEIITHVGRESPYQQPTTVPFAGYVPFPSQDGDAIDCTPYTYAKPAQPAPTEHPVLAAFVKAPKRGPHR